MRAIQVQGRQRDEAVVTQALATHTWLERSQLRALDVTGRSLERLLPQLQANQLIVVAFAPMELGSSSCLQFVGWRANCFTTPALDWHLDQLRKPKIQLTEYQAERLQWFLDELPSRQQTQTTISLTREGRHPMRGLMRALFPSWAGAQSERRSEFMLTMADWPSN